MKLATNSASEMRSLWQQAIANRTARIGVIGLGYVGLPLLRVFWNAGYSVHGFDVDRIKTAALRRGESYIGRVPSSWVAEALSTRRLELHDDFGSIRRADAIVICVPTPLTKQKDPDLSYVAGTAREIGRSLERGKLVILESTTYPSTTEEVVKPILEESGLECGRDFHLAFSPEREDPGNDRFHTAIVPKLSCLQAQCG